MNAPAPLTLDEIRLAAAAVTALLQKYADRSPIRLKLKCLQLRMFAIEQTLTGDHPRFVEAMNAATANEWFDGEEWRPDADALSPPR